jgi:hypothetical protein
MLASSPNHNEKGARRGGKEEMEQGDAYDEFEENAEIVFRIFDEAEKCLTRRSPVRPGGTNEVVNCKIVTAR